MKAAVVVANEDVRYQEVEEPQVKPGYVKIKVKASAVPIFRVYYITAFTFILSYWDMNFPAM